MDLQVDQSTPFERGGQCANKERRRMRKRDTKLIHSFGMKDSVVDINGKATILKVQLVGIAREVLEQGT